MVEKGKEKVNSEELCFVCKTGGSLFICSFKNCPKAYHAGCAGKDELSLNKTGGRFPCKWHSCFICDDHSTYQCYCCPRAVCERCIVNAEFAKLTGTKGFCINCIKLILPPEMQEAADSEGDKVDLKGRNTSERLLYEYCVMLKRKEYERSVPTFAEEDTGSEFSIGPLPKGKRSKDQKALKKRQVKSKKIEYIGWGSKPLIHFLLSIGIDTSKEISQGDVVSIIDNYSKENNLFDGKKNRRIVCDERLNTLFEKRKFMRNKIYDLLDVHYREYADFEKFFEQDQHGYSSEEKIENDSNLLASKKQKKTDEFINPKEEVVIEAPRSCFASIVSDNIKLVYLKQSVAMELLKEPETFESMLIGSFVRVKSDPNDDMQKNHNQLVKVTGVKKTSLQGKKEDILLQVSNRFEDFSISKLSDGDFSEAECQDLSKRVENGQLQKLALVEIEEKAISLHQVITKQWIVRELNMLQNKIDRANERGMRAEFFQLIERRELLETEAEQNRLLEEVPKVIAEVLETKNTPQVPPISIFTAKSETLGHQWLENTSSSGDKADAKYNLSGSTGPMSANYGYRTTKGDEAPRNNQGDKADAEYNSLFGSTGSISANYGYGTPNGDEAPRNNQDSDEEESDCNDQSGAIQRSEPRQRGSQVQIQSDHVGQKIAQKEKASPIEFRSDDDDCDCSSNYILKMKTGDLAPICHCLGPKGEREGPFSMSFLKRWGKLNRYYFLMFEVGKTGENATPLAAQLFANLQICLVICF